MSPTQKEIDWALGASEWNQPARILAAAYRAEKIRTELAKRQYAELKAWCLGDGIALEFDLMISRHGAEHKSLKDNS